MINYTDTQLRFENPEKTVSSDRIPNRQERSSSGDMDGRNLSETERYSNYLMNYLVPLLYRSEQRRVQLRGGLFGEEFKVELEPKYKAIQIIEGEKKIKGRPVQELIDGIKSSIKAIRQSDPELASMVDSIDAKGKYPILERMVLILEKYPPERAYSHFKQFYKWYEKKLSEEPYLKTGREVIKGVLTFLLEYSKTEKETNVISAFKEKVSQWNIPYQEIDEYIKQGDYFVRYLQTFKDPAIMPRLDDPRIVQLLQYLREKTFFASILRRIEVGEQQDAWQEFERFYKGIKKISEEVRIRFGDLRDSKVLLEIKRKYHESPEDWKRSIQQILAELEKKKGEIISKARAAFEKLFLEDLSKVRGVQLASLITLKEAIKSIGSRTSKEAERNLNILFEEVKKKREGCEQRIKAKREEYAEEEAKKDNDGKTFLERRAAFIELFQTILMIDPSIGAIDQQDVGGVISDAQQSFGRIVKNVPALVSLSGSIRSKNTGFMAQAIERLIIFAGGTRAEENRVDRDAVILKKSLIHNFRANIEECRALLKRTQELVVYLENLLGLNSYKYN